MRFRISEHLSRKLSSLTKSALLVSFQAPFALALYSKYASLNLLQTSEVICNFSQASVVSLFPMREKISSLLMYFYASVMIALQISLMSTTNLGG